VHLRLDLVHQYLDRGCGVAHDEECVRVVKRKGTCSETALGGRDAYVGDVGCGEDVYGGFGEMREGCGERGALLAGERAREGACGGRWRNALGFCGRRRSDFGRLRESEI
jgi:hypothetical protein